VSGAARTLMLWDEDEVATRPAFPSTRYQGSKARIVDWLMACLEPLDFVTALDLFGGTGAVSYALKAAGKEVTYNDLLRFNHQVGLALIENPSTRLRQDAVADIIEAAGRSTGGFVTDTFQGVYYTDDENRWVDGAVRAIRALADPYEGALAYWALFQSCIAKRPFNLFHRKNLYIRTARVERSFGNKTTWDRPFEDHFRGFAREANRGVFDNGRPNRALNLDATEVVGHYGLVYLDPPYLAADGNGVDYYQFYHFLEGLVRYDEWPSLVDYSRRHRPLKTTPNPWGSRSTIERALLDAFRGFPEAILAVSYRDNGCPSPQRIAELLGMAGRADVEMRLLPYQYVLSTTAGHEVLLVSRP